MDKGKRPMGEGSGSRRSERRDFQRPMEDERSIKKRNDEADLKAREEREWNMFYNKMRKYTTRKNKRGKDWVPTEQEVEDEKEKYPEVIKLFSEGHTRIWNTHFSTVEEVQEQFAALRAKCAALQKELDERDEREWWAAWNADNK